MHYIYILHSPSLNKYYIGETEDLTARLIQHQTHFFKGSSTAMASDWIVVWSFDVNTRIRARKIEAFLKKQKSKSFISRFIANESISNSVLSKF